MKFMLQEIRKIATGPCIANQLRDVNTYAGEAGILLHIFGKFMILKLKSSRLSYFLVLSWPLSSNSRYMSKNDGYEAVYVVSLTSSSGGYINVRNSANLELLIDNTSSIYLYVKLKALVSWIFLSFTSFWRNSDSYEYKNKSARRGAQFVPIGMPTTCWNNVPPKETNMLSMRNSNILITCSSE
jgi:hypothetical protein